MQARAEAAEATRHRIMMAARDLIGKHWYADVTLEQIAREAGVTVQTVIRRFGSKDGLVDAAINELTPTVESQRAQAPAGDVAGAIQVLADHYEEWGELSMRVLAQEERVPALERLAAIGRALHREWVEQTFEPFLNNTQKSARARRTAQLVALTDVYMWTLLRRDCKLKRRDTEKALVEMIQGLVG
jgi:AcrR family transcriptional regulator